MHLTIRIPGTHWQITASRWALICWLGAALSTLLTLTACTTAWTTEAANIVNLLAAAIPTLLTLLSMAGVGISQDVIGAASKWANEATNDLTNLVLPLIKQYEQAEAAARPGILNTLDAAVQTLAANMKAILPALHVDNEAKQSAIEQLVGPIAQEITALVDLIPVLKGGIADHNEVKRRVAALMSPSEFSDVWTEAQEQFKQAIAAADAAATA